MKKSFLSLFFIFLSAIGFVYSEDWPLGFPTANTKVKNSVPIESLRKIALLEAQGTWGVVTPISEIPCCDMDGNVLYYMFVFQIGTGTLKNYNQIMENIKEGRSLYKELIKQKRNEDYSQEFRNQKEIIRKKIWGYGEFGTLLLSARDDLLPLIQRIHGLPHYFVKGDLMQNKAQKVIGGNPKITRIYFGGVANQWYEFSNKDKSVLISPFTLEIVPLDKVISIQKEKIKIYKNRTQIINKEWKKLKDRIEKR